MAVTQSPPPYLYKLNGPLGESLRTEVGSRWRRTKVSRRTLSGLREVTQKWDRPGTQRKGRD